MLDDTGKSIKKLCIGKIQRRKLRVTTLFYSGLADGTSRGAGASLDITVESRHVFARYSGVGREAPGRIRAGLRLSCTCRQLSLRIVSAVLPSVHSLCKLREFYHTLRALSRLFFISGQKRFEPKNISKTLYKTDT